MLAAALGGEGDLAPRPRRCWRRAPAAAPAPRLRHQTDALQGSDATGGGLTASEASRRSAPCDTLWPAHCAACDAAGESEAQGARSNFGAEEGPWPEHVAVQIGNHALSGLDHCNMQCAEVSRGLQCIVSKWIVVTPGRRTMYINKRIDHAMAGIVEVGISMQRSRHPGYAVRFLEKLHVEHAVIQRVMEQPALRRYYCTPPGRMTYNLVNRKRLDVVRDLVSHSW